MKNSDHYLSNSCRFKFVNNIHSSTSNSLILLPQVLINVNITDIYSFYQIQELLLKLAHKIRIIIPYFLQINEGAACSKYKIM